MKELFIEKLEKDTRDDSDLFVYRLKDQLDYKEFKRVSELLKSVKIYYSKFKGGFISKEKIDFDSLDFEKAPAKAKEKTSNKIIYNKLLSDNY